jgi:hypothetical protein
MDSDKSLIKILKWAGIAALVALPIVVLLKKHKKDEFDPHLADEDDIFSSELSD